MPPFVTVMAFLLCILTVNGEDSPSFRGLSYGEVDYSSKGLNWSEGECGSDVRQSPIDIVRSDAIQLRGRGITWSYGTAAGYEGGVQVINTGNGIQVEPLDGNATLGVFNVTHETRDPGVEDDSFVALQYHFHAPAEHSFDGVLLPLEMHIVHKHTRIDNVFAVLGITFVSYPDSYADTETQVNPFLAALLARPLPETGGDSYNLTAEEGVPDFNQLLSSGEYPLFYYQGSLTTPPCSEAVEWYVIDLALPATVGQLKTLTDALGQNARAIMNHKNKQPLYSLIGGPAMRRRQLSDANATWSYEGQGTAWEDMGDCGSTERQSPIDFEIDTIEQGPHSVDVHLNYHTGIEQWNVENTGHTLQYTLVEPADNHTTDGDNVTETPHLRRAAAAPPGDGRALIDQLTVSAENGAGHGSIISDNLSWNASRWGMGVAFVQNQGYRIAQFHFHSPAEHLFGGVRRPLELHIVHLSMNNTGEALVLGVTFIEGPADQPNSFLSSVLQEADFPQAGDGRDVDLSPVGNIWSVLPYSGDTAYHYKGSLTTPPCTEFVNWYVLRDPLKASRAQLDRFEQEFSYTDTQGNYRAKQNDQNTQSVYKVLVTKEGEDVFIPRNISTHAGGGHYESVAARVDAPLSLLTLVAISTLMWLR
mmetsp:Transcript_39384/g.98531  ORF Transcript_39384/g.98531 Transcript_39384/m.98531 type:complete len:646 (+) Transcript_39384:49-1986(+)